MTLTQEVDPTRFRATLGHYPTGVVLVTAIDATGAPVGMVVGSFTSVSLDPPLVAFLPTRGSERFARLRTASSFCVNVLASDQGDLCRRFSTKGVEDFTGIAWTPSPSGAPVVAGAVAWIDCTFESEVDGGDHAIVLGRVRALDVANPVAPLLFHQGGFGRFAPLS
ncbi:MULTISPECIES: flavin reductase family protein [unclassified Geodermatophilus]|uniref:flavin reductase family protein n=1 Tax=unclassified Geodermatophilus TaxID=2637632 RepID=UPI003EEDCD64